MGYIYIHTPKVTTGAGTFVSNVAWRLNLYVSVMGTSAVYVVYQKKGNEWTIPFDE